MRIFVRLGCVVLAMGWCIGIPFDPETEYQVMVTQRITFKKFAMMPILPKISIASGSLGTAVAVDGDGMLLTARHVVDQTMGDGNGTLCDMASVIERLDLDLEVRDSNGRAWKGHAVAQISDTTFCDMFGRIGFRWDENPGAYIVERDSLVDIALIHIRANKIPHITPRASARPALAERVVLVGRPFGKRSLRTRGRVISECRRFRHVGKWLLIDEPVVLMDAPALGGMSGGPVLAGDTLIGITVMRGEIIGSLAVSGAYAAQWYEWVVGKTNKKPSIACPGGDE